MALLVGGPLGGLLVLSAAAGAFTFRRRRRTAADAPTCARPLELARLVLLPSGGGLVLALAEEPLPHGP